MGQKRENRGEKWREGGTDLPFLPAGCSDHSLIWLLQPAPTHVPDFQGGTRLPLQEKPHVHTCNKLHIFVCVHFFSLEMSIPPVHIQLVMPDFQRSVAQLATAVMVKQPSAAAQ